MDGGVLEQVSISSLKDGRYVNITHRGTARDVYPVEVRDGRFYAWCSLHPTTVCESFLLENITAAYIGGSIWYVPAIYSKIAEMAG